MWTYFMLRVAPASLPVFVLCATEVRSDHRVGSPLEGCTNWFNLAQCEPLNVDRLPQVRV